MAFSSNGRLRLMPERSGYPVVFNYFLRQCLNMAEAEIRAHEFWTSLPQPEKDRRNAETRAAWRVAHPPKPPQPIEGPEQKAE